MLLVFLIYNIYNSKLPVAVKVYLNPQFLPVVILNTVSTLSIQPFYFIFLRGVGAKLLFQKIRKIISRVILHGFSEDETFLETLNII